MKFSFSYPCLITVLSAFFISFCISAPSFAQDDTAAVYMPTSAWLVGPASLGDAAQAGGKMPCVVANQFGNGFVLRLSGGGGHLMAMAIDFKQKAFEPRRKYEVQFSVPGVFFQSLQGAAYDQQTLLFGLQKMPKFYESLKSAEKLVITVAEASVALNLTGLDDGFQRMEGCYAPGGVAPEQKSANRPDSAAPVKGSTQNPLIARNNALTPMPGEEAMAMAAQPVPERAPIEAPDAQLSVNAVLNDVAKAAAPVPGGSAGFLIAKAQEAEEAAKRLSANSPNKPSEGKAMAGNWTKPDVVRPNGADIMAGGSNAAPAKNANQNMRWRALKGANLQDVLRLWTDGAGVGLMWLADANFPVQRSLSMEGNFETAVQALLEQYDGQTSRPVGRIYREPGSQSLVLVVEGQ